MNDNPRLPESPPELVKAARCIALDAVGTVIRPDPPASIAYWLRGQKYGAALDEATVRKRIRRAFNEIEAADRRFRLETSEEREVERWRTIVHEVFRELPEETRDHLFEELFEYFSHGAAWSLYDDARAIIPVLRNEGKRLILASNFDSRLQRVLQELGIAAWFDAVIISSHVGWRKPARQFFEAIVKRCKCEPEATLYVGDDYENDYVGATAAGLNAVLVDRRRGCRESPAAICVPDLRALYECPPGTVRDPV